MRLLFAFISKILLVVCFFISSAHGQDLPINDSDSTLEDSPGETSPVIQEDDTAGILNTGNAPLIRRLEISLDYLKLVSFVMPSETKMEGGFAIITKPNVGISIEIGYGARMPEDHFKNAEYKVDGMYGRAGLSYHIPFNPTTNLFIGAKYGMSSYQDEATYTIESGLWDPYQDSFQRTGLSARWAEMIAGSESRFKGNFYFGFMIRFRVMISQDNFEPLEVFSVPGYGRALDKTIPALNLYIKYMINFEKLMP